MRLRCPSPRSPAGRALVAVRFNTRCRDEIIPILRALQHLYRNPKGRRQILDLVAHDVNPTTSRFYGRPGMSYWEIIVLAAVRLGCNLDYDKLQDLAENHRRLQRLMGISPDQENDITYDWRSIRDNLALLRPATLTKLNQLIVAQGHQLVPEAAQSVRGDSFVVESNIHYPTDSTLIGDGLRKLLEQAGPLAHVYRLPGWRQYQHLLKKTKTLVARINKASRRKGRHAKERLQEAYRPLLRLAGCVLTRVRRLLRTLPDEAAQLLRTQTLEQFLPRTEQVVQVARRRVLQHESVANTDKLFSVFEAHTELIKRGKAAKPNQFGHRVLVIEDAVGFVCHYEVMGHGVQDQDIVVPALQRLQGRLQGNIRQASFDRGFHTPENQQELAKIVSCPCLAAPGKAAAKNETVTFRQTRQRHPGVESAIGALQAGNGQVRCRDRGLQGYQRYVGLGMFGRNLQVLGKLLLASEEPRCLAGRSKRKRPPTAIN